MALHDRVHGCFAFGDRVCARSRARCIDLLIQLFGFSRALDVNGRGALAFTRQPFGLQRESFERSFKLATDLHQTLGDSRVRQKFRARALDLASASEASTSLLAVSGFSRLKQTACSLRSRRAAQRPARAGARIPPRRSTSRARTVSISLSTSARRFSSAATCSC